MKLTNQQLLKAGIRSAEPVPECKGYKGWIAKARFRLTDQEVMVLGTHYFYQSEGTELDNKFIYQYIEDEDIIKPIPTEEGRLASFSYKEIQQSVFQQESTETDENTDKKGSFDGHLTLIRNRQRGNDGFFFVPDLSFSAAVRYLAIQASNVDNIDPLLFWWVFRGEPEDLDKVYYWHQKSYGYAFNETTENSYFVQAIDINPNGEDGYCSRGVVHDESTIFGMVCKFTNSSSIKSFNKIVGNIRARVADVQLAKKNPWFKGPRWHEQTYYLNFPDDPELQPVHKKGQNFTQSTTDNIIGLSDTEAYDLELYISQKQIIQGIEVEVPDQRVSARLHSVEFYYCGCINGEIECEGPDGELCCVDCCKIGKFITSLF